jgi:hypothetical protein
MKSTTYEQPTSKIPPVFIEERRYLKNVTTKTIAWYEQTFKQFDGALDSKESINARIVALRQKGIAAISINSRLTCINAFLRWRGDTYKIPKLQTEKKVLKTFSQEDVRKLQQYRARSKSQKRALSLLLLDSGLRIAKPWHFGPLTWTSTTV